MNDFLQFVDRVPTLPNRKKITHADSSVEYATIEYADEPVETGTPLNRAHLYKINANMGYNSVIGQWNPTTQTAEFTLTNYNVNELLDNEAVKIKQTNEVIAPADNLLNIIPVTQKDRYYSGLKSLKLKNGNIIVAGHSSYDLYLGLIEVNNNYNFRGIQFASSGYSTFDLIQMSNGNIMVVGASSDNNNYLFNGIVDSNLNIVTASSNTGITGMRDPRIIEASNGNLIVVGYSQISGWDYECSAVGFDNQGTRIFNKTQISGQMQEPKIVAFDNGNNLIAGGYGPIKYSIINSQGNIIKSATSISNFGYINAIKLDNDRVLVAGISTNTSKMKYYIIENDGTIFYDSGNTTYNGSSTVKLTKLINGNILINYESYYHIINQNGEIEYSNLYMVANNLDFVQMNNGNVLFYRNKNNTWTIGIIDLAGTVIFEKSAGYWYGGMIQLSNNNIIVLSYSNDYLYFEVDKPYASAALATLNGVTIDTFLQKDNFYELIYNESQNKFIAEEVRNAN